MRLFIFYMTTSEEVQSFIELMNANNHYLISLHRNGGNQIIPIVTDVSLGDEIFSSFSKSFKNTLNSLEGQIIHKIPVDESTKQKLHSMIKGFRNENYEEIFFVYNPNKYLSELQIDFKSRMPIHIKRYLEFRYILKVGFAPDKKTGDDLKKENVNENKKTTGKVTEDEVCQAFETLSGLFPRETNWQDIALLIVGAVYSYYVIKSYLKFSNEFAKQFAKAIDLTEDQEKTLTTFTSIAVAIANGEITARTFKLALEQLYQKVKAVISKRDLALFLMLLSVLGISVVQAIPNIKYAQEADAAEPSQKVIQPVSSIFLGNRAIMNFLYKVWVKQFIEAILKARQELIPILNQLTEKPLNWKRESLLINGKIIEESENVTFARDVVKGVSVALPLYYCGIFAKMGFDTFTLDTEVLWRLMLEYSAYLGIAVVSGGVKEALLVINAWFPTIDKTFDLFGTKIINDTEKPFWQSIYNALNLLVCLPLGVLSMANAAEIIVVNGPFKSTSLGYLIFALLMSYAAAGPINTGDMVNNHADMLQEVIRLCMRIYTRCRSLEEYNSFIYGKNFEQFIQRIEELIALKSDVSVYYDWTEKLDPKKDQIYLDNEKIYGNSTLRKYKDASFVLARAKEQGMDLNEIYQRRFLKEHGMKKVNVNDVEMGESKEREKEPLLSGMKL